MYLYHQRFVHSVAELSLASHPFIWHVDMEVDAFCVLLKRKCWDDTEDRFYVIFRENKS